jgi:omega-6 fatty acid desaturase (delta-12 desaturase)
MTRSVIEVAITVLPFIVLWALAAVALVSGHWWGLVLTVPAAAFLVRLLVLQHDCGQKPSFPDVVPITGPVAPWVC